MKIFGSHLFQFDKKWWVFVGLVVVIQALLILFSVGIGQGDDSPPYVIKSDPPTNENFSQIYLKMFNHKHDNDGSSKFDNLDITEGLTIDGGDAFSVNVTSGVSYVPFHFTTTTTFKGPIPFHDVTAWGLVGDDSTDNLALASAMFAAVPSAGGIYYFPPGIYKFTNTPVIPPEQDNITIIGAGPQLSVWKFYHPTSNPNGITFSDAENITIKDIGIDGENIVMDTQRNAITFAGTSFGVKHGLIDNVHIINWQGGGILLNTCEDVTVRNSYIYRQYEHGIYAAGSNHCKIINNTFYESAPDTGGSNAAIKVATFSDCLISGNHVYHSSGTAFIVQAGSYRTKIDGNHFDIINDAAAISFDDTSADVDVSDNFVYFSGGGSGKAIYFGSGGSMSRINLRDNTVISLSGKTAFDISVATVTACNITGNSFYNGGTGVGIDLGGQSSGNIITGNVFSNYSSGTGIQLGANTSGNEVHSNQFYTVTTSVSNLAGTSLDIVDVSATTANVYFKNTKASGQGDMFVHAVKASNGNSAGFKVGTGANEKWAIGTGFTAIDEVLKIRDQTNGVNIAMFTQNGGMQVGSPTGGDKGVGTINVSGDIYKNNTAYTNPDYVFEFWDKGYVEQFSDNSGADDYDGKLLLDDLEGFIEKNYQLPGVGEAKGVFGRMDAYLEKLEEAYLYIIELHNRLTALEDFLSKRRWGNEP